MRFDVVTLFPAIFDGYLTQSLLEKAITKGLVEIHRHDMRDWAADTPHRKVDDRPFGGGPGMLLRRLEVTYTSTVTIPIFCLWVRRGVRLRIRCQWTFFTGLLRTRDLRLRLNLIVPSLLYCSLRARTGCMVRRMMFIILNVSNKTVGV